MEQRNREQLKAAIARLQRADALLNYRQLQGFLFAMACSPEQIKTSEWFELIWLNDEPQFDDEAEAKTFFSDMTAWYAEQQSDIAKGHCLPFAETYDEAWQEGLTQWCEGFLIGHQYLEELWVVALSDLGREDIADAIDAALNLTTTFSDLFSAKQLSLEDGLELCDEHLPEAYAMLVQVLVIYADTGRHWRELQSVRDTEQMFLELSAVPREQLCPCGSGVAFAKCCLH